MRDPLRNVSVRFKLALTFLFVCLLAFGVGGALVSRSAREALESEIMARLRFEAQSYATALEGGLRGLGQRARDFASDGYIRTQFERLVDGASPDVGPALRQHLCENKIGLEPAFVNLALVGAGGETAFLAFPDDSLWMRGFPLDAMCGGDWYSGLVPPQHDDEPAAIVIATPVSSLSGERKLGMLLVNVRTDAWITGSLGALGLAEAAGDRDSRLVLIDRGGQAIEVPSDVITSGVRASEVPFRIRDEITRPHGDASTRGVFSQCFPIATNGWSLQTQLKTQVALSAVAGLQGRFLLVGIVLTVTASLVLLFPMRFLARPLRELRDAAMNIGKGEFSARVPVESRDEIGELSRSFNLMADAVEERAAKLKAAARSLRERKDELRHERDRLNAVILSMRDGLIVLDEDGRPELWNAAAEPLRAIVESGGADLSPHRLCHRAHSSSVGEKALGNEGGHPCLNCLFEPAAPPRSCLVDAGSQVFEIHSTDLARSTCDRTARVGRVLIARDVTDRAAQDEQEMHQERLAVLGEVAAVMAHELNNPLAAIQMFTQMIRSKLPEDSPLLEEVSVIERNTVSCGRTIRELLDYATGASPEVGPVDIHQCLSAVVAFLRPFRERKRVELLFDPEAGDAVVVGDEVQLRQVFINLVLNAVQAVEGVDEPGRIAIRTSFQGAHLLIDVEDNGPGIPPDIAESVFRPFFTTKPRGAGTGLGLSTARRITEIQGGGLELFDARPGHTTFRVRLLRGSS